MTGVRSAVPCQVVHIVPEALEAAYWEANAEAPALPQYGTPTLYDSDQAAASVSTDAPAASAAPDTTELAPTKGST